MAMLSHRIATSRTLPYQLLRPVLIRKQPHGPRLFTHNSQLLLLARHTPRPQLPYLSQPSFLRRPSPLDQQILRLLSTETRQFIKNQAWLSAKWGAIIWVFIVASSIAAWGYRMEVDERRAATPSSLSFWAREALRAARNEIEDRQAQGYVNWVAVGKLYKEVLERAEDPKRDGKGVTRHEADGEGGVIMIPEVGTVGIDISSKDWPWRQCYFEALMGVAQASEHTEDMVRDTTRNVVFPKSVVVGPSNPDPRPVTKRMLDAPKEEDCASVFDPPQTFYMQILTGIGFTTKQKLEAAWAYARWLEYTNLNDSADEMYRWAIDIAKTPLSNPDATIDSSTYVLKSADGNHYSEAPSSNLLRAVTLFASHRARTSDLSSALPILLSALRARREAPVSPYPTADRPSAHRNNTDLDATVNFLRQIFVTPKFPPPPPSGDDALVKTHSLPTCEDSELMLYIGEIMYASSPKMAEGLSWTREAVETAERGIQLLSRSSGNAEAEREQATCRQCLRAGLANWETMLQQAAAQATTTRAREGGRNAGMLEWRGWFGKDGGVKGQTLDEAQDGVFQAEFAKLERLKDKVARDHAEAEMRKYAPPRPFAMFLG